MSFPGKPRSKRPHAAPSSWSSRLLAISPPPQAAPSPAPASTPSPAPAPASAPDAASPPHSAPVPAPAPDAAPPPQVAPAPDAAPPPQVAQAPDVALSTQAAEKKNPRDEGRRCLHCDTDKTPLWRMGPEGRRTLCNACGMRYKSGRLAPEYRPLASPTFVPSKHSNSHRKIVQLRGHKESPTFVLSNHSNSHRKVLQLPFSADESWSESPTPISVKKPPREGDEGRRCLNCDTDTTSQWRRGPKGPRTLCDACGLHYRAGWLVPEYRPAARVRKAPRSLRRKERVRRCLNCETDETRQWRTGPRGPRTLCDACGKDYRKLLIEHSNSQVLQLPMDDSDFPVPMPIQVREAPRVVIKRRCMNCRTDKTPQWRTGPMGPRTLCNSCGVLYLSGMLVPEYPAEPIPSFLFSERSPSKAVQLPISAAESWSESGVSIPMPMTMTMTVSKAPWAERKKDPSDKGRRCLHCTTKKTSHWRTGPKGPRTLCNACGKRYVSACLVPEYSTGTDPSPTLVLSEYSRSEVLQLPVAAVEATAESLAESNITIPAPDTVGKKRVRKKDPQAKAKCCLHCQTVETPQWRTGPAGPGTLCNACGKEEVRKKDPPAKGKCCLHCQTVETPQWRTGPAGPGTLCNACGVRYRSGRLVPEYRPVASPTFVPSEHSNSHRKVLLLRCQKEVTDHPQHQQQQEFFENPCFFDFDTPDPSSANEDYLIDDGISPDYMHLDTYNGQTSF